MIFHLLGKKSREKRRDCVKILSMTNIPLKIAFLIIFLDIMSFSLIFPLFPQLLQYYLEHDGDNKLLHLISGPSTFQKSTIFFGGILGSLYSLLQFIASPLWGGLSDKVGRRPILLLSTTAMALSYALWIFANSFTLLLIARFLGGIMGGNISVATAVAADVTDEKSRSKGMAVIGVAFALGFILGPAIGGITSLVRLDLLFPNLILYGLNPFSATALSGTLLSLLSLYILRTKFQETLLRGKTKGSERTINVLKIFQIPTKGAFLCCLAYFLFVVSFSGMEFSLAFLAAERFHFSSLDNAWMFVTVGVILALVQGGIVRKKASEVGEKKMSLIGLGFVFPGLIIIGYAKSIMILYGGLFFLSVGSAMAIPCLTALVSLYSPSERQGGILGVFRSLGALGRVLGPLAASFLYWRFSSAHPYFVGAAFILIPLGLVALLPKRVE